MTVGILSFGPFMASVASSIFMAAPDILAFTVNDPPLVPGNTETGSFSGNAYGTWFQRTNPVGGATEWCVPFGPLRDRVRYSDKPPETPLKDKVALHTLGNYLLTGASASAVYFRDEGTGQGMQRGSGGEFLYTQRHTIYLKLNAIPTNGTVISVANTAANTFEPFTFTYNDKQIRAGGIQINQIGQRPDDAFRYGYLAMRIPGGPNNGAVDFATTYGKTSFQILDSAKATVFTGSIVPRVGALEIEKTAVFTGFIDNGTGGGSPSGIAGTKLTVTAVTTGYINGGSTLSGSGVTGTIINQDFTAFSGGVGTYNVSTSQLVTSRTMSTMDGLIDGMDIADIAQGVTVTGVTTGASTIVTCPGHTFNVNDKVRLFAINGMPGISVDPSTLGPVIPTGAAGGWIAGKVTAKDTTTVTVNYNSTGFPAFTPATSEYSAALGGVNNKIYKCFTTNRAGTFVFGLDFSGWTPGASGTHYIYIPGYGISDPFLIQSNAWAIAAGKTHQGVFTQRLGCAVSSDSGYTRGIALADGVNGCTNYQSTLPAFFCTEDGQAYTPAGTLLAQAPMGGAFNAGTLALSSLNSGGTTTATATTTAPHGITNGTSFWIQPVNFTPSGYNFLAGYATPRRAMVTGTSTFTFPVDAGLGAATVMGTIRSGFVTTTRTGVRAAVQDAGDCDDVANNHIPGYALLAMVFRNIPKPARFTPFTVPLSTTLLNSTLYANTDALPPIFHELFWYADHYRQGQMGDGSIWGGTGIGRMNESAIAEYPETIDYYRGTSAGGTLTGQTVMAFAYARDHFTTFMYAGLAAQLAMIAYDYSSTIGTTLGDTWKASAIAAYAWADGIMTNVTTRNTYYNGTLNLQSKMGWTTTQYNEGLNEMSRRSTLEKFNAAGSLYRLLGSTTGAAYGAFIDKSFVQFPSLANAGGSGYAVNDFITVASTGSTGKDVDAVFQVTGIGAGGAITSFTTVVQGQYTTLPTTPLVQGATTGAGSGATFSCSAGKPWTSFYGQNTVGVYDYCKTTGANTTTVAFLTDPANYYTGNAAVGLCTAQCYSGMQFDVTPVGQRINFMGLAAPNKPLQGHLMSIITSGGIVAGSRTDSRLKLMQAGCSFQLGANLPNKAFQTGTGPRPFINLLHEDSWAKGTAPPNGIFSYGYFAFGSSLMYNNFLGQPVGDSGAYFNSDNISGAYQANVIPGSAKMWNPWRFGSAFWEWSPENHNIIYNSEFDLSNSLLATLAVQLYLHGWDGNV